MNTILSIVKKIIAFFCLGGGSTSTATQDAIVEEGAKDIVAASTKLVDLDKIRQEAYAKIDQCISTVKSAIDKFYNGDAKQVITKIKTMAENLKAKDVIGLTKLPDIKCIFDLAENSDKIASDIYNKANAGIDDLAADAKARVANATSEETIDQITDIACKVISAESGKLVDLLNARLKI